MKAITAVCATGASVPAVVNGRVSRHRDGENAEIKMYLSKLKDLVPFMPKNRKLSKLEIIQHVIDYICDLQSELETHPAVSSFDAAAALNGQQQHQQQQQQQQQAQQQRQHQQINGTSEQLSNLNHQGNSHNFSQSAATSPTSSSPQRQPLCVRPNPNTILSTTHTNPLSSVAPSGQTHHISINSSHSHTTTEKPNGKERPHC